MIASMTGFGRSMIQAPYGNVIVEIQSINRKYLEVFVSLPKEFSRFENEIRKIVSEHLLRGQISVRIHILPNPSAVQQNLPDLELLRALKTGWEGIAESLGYKKEVIDFSFLVQHATANSRQELARDTDFEPIENCLKQALKDLQQMKVKEGASLAQDIQTRLKELARLLHEIERQAPDATGKMRKKLKERMEEIFQPSAELDDRLLREVALFAERADTSEEITRFRSHLAQYSELFKGHSTGSGRKMDFLVQEMGREVNTIGSKSMDAKIAHLVVEMKSELEKIREQIQNIE